MMFVPSPETLPGTIRRLRAAGCVFAEDEATILIEAARNLDDLAELVARRVAGLPLEQIVGWAEFCGLRIVVEPGVFVPRRRTEFLVRQAAALTRSGAVVLDMCCGTGAVGAAIVVAVTGVELYAVDVEPAAVRCAHRNLDPLGGQVFHGDLYEPLPSHLLGRVDVLVANAPYVPTAAIGLMPPEARLHEPRVALDGGPDGLDVQRRVTAGAAAWLVPGGQLLIETSAGQAPLTIEIFAQYGLSPRVVDSDEFDATVVIGSPVDAQV